MSNNSKLKRFLNLRKEWNRQIAAGNVINANTSPHAVQNAIAAVSDGQTSAQLAQMANAPEPEPEQAPVAKPRRACQGFACTLQGGKRRRSRRVKRRSTKRRRVKN